MIVFSESPLLASSKPNPKRTEHNVVRQSLT
jgi:hypothetical protein